MDWLAVSDDISETFTVGEVLSVVSLSLDQRLTTPPDYLSESELISLMEKHGIGTDASIPMHISSIVDRNFASVGPNRTMVPSTLGITLIHGYHKIDPDLCSPTMRAALETQLDLIAKGVEEYEHVVDHFVRVFLGKFQYFEKKIGKMDDLFEQHFSTLEQTHGRMLGKCGKCTKWSVSLCLSAFLFLSVSVFRSLSVAPCVPLAY